MTSFSPQEFRALLRQDFYSFMHRSFGELNPGTTFLHNWHLELIASKLTAVLRGECRRLIIMVPPRSLKSHAASIAFSAFVLGHHPAKQIVCASYSQGFCGKARTRHPPGDEQRLLSPTLSTICLDRREASRRRVHDGSRRKPFHDFAQRRTDRPRRIHHFDRRPAEAGRSNVGHAAESR